MISNEARRQMNQQRIAKGNWELVSRTGDHCPRSGWWVDLNDAAQESEQTATFVSQGNVMPAREGSPTQWLGRPDNDHNTIRKAGSEK